MNVNEAEATAEAVLIRTLTSDREHVIIASDPPNSDDAEAMADFVAFLNQASQVGRELAATFATADGKLAVVLRRRAGLVAAAGPLPGMPGGPPLRQ